MFGNEPSPTLPLQLLKRATERAVETGGRPTKAVRRLWQRVQADPRLAASLGEMGESATALGDWLALTGGDRQLEQMLAGNGLGKANEIVADGDRPEPRRMHPVPIPVLRKARKKGDRAMSMIDGVKKKRSKTTKRARQLVKAAGGTWSDLSDDEKRAAKALARQERAQQQLAKALGGPPRPSMLDAGGTAAVTSEERVAGLTKAAADMGNPAAAFAARKELERLAVVAVSPALVSLVPGVRVAQNRQSGLSDDGFEKLRR